MQILLFYIISFNFSVKLIKSVQLNPCFWSVEDTEYVNKTAREGNYQLWESQTKQAASKIVDILTEYSILN